MQHTKWNAQMDKMNKIGLIAAGLGLVVLVIVKTITVNMLKEEIRHLKTTQVECVEQKGP